MSNKVLVIGAINIDINIQSNKPYTMHDSNVVNRTINIGGVGGNIAQNLARLGAQVDCLTILGSDSFSHDIMAQFQKLGIAYNQSFITDHNSNLYISVLDEQGDLLIGLNDMKSIDALTPELLATKFDYINGFDTIVIDNNLTEEAIRYILQHFHDKFLVMDAVSSEKAHKLLGAFDYVNLVKMNNLEYETIFKGKPKLQNSIFDLVDKKLQLLITNHHHKIVLHTAQKTYKKTPIPCKNIVSTSGAGDALLSGYLYGLLIQKEPEEALQIGIDLAYQTLLVPTSTTSEVNRNE